jgi:hypothetical protein
MDGSVDAPLRFAAELIILRRARLPSEGVHASSRRSFGAASHRLSLEQCAIAWDPALPDGPHRMTRVEAVAAGAALGIANAITGKGHDEIARVLAKFDRARHKSGVRNRAQKQAILKNPCDMEKACRKSIFPWPVGRWKQRREKSRNNCAENKSFLHRPRRRAKKSLITGTQHIQNSRRQLKTRAHSGA